MTMTKTLTATFAAFVLAGAAPAFAQNYAKTTTTGTIRTRDAGPLSTMRRGEDNQSADGILHQNLLSAMPQTSEVPDYEDAVFFADFVVGAGWSFQVAVSNNSPTRSLTGLLGVAVDKSMPGAVSWGDAINSGGVRFFSLPPGGTRIFDNTQEGGLPAPAEGFVRGGLIILQLSGFAAFESDSQMLSAVLTYRNDATGMEVSVPPLRYEDLEPPFFNAEPAYAIFVEESETVSSGVALWKSPENEVCMHLVGLDGQLFQNPEGHDTICYAPQHGDQFTHSASMLAEWFPDWDFSEGFQGRLVIYVQDNTFGKGNDGISVPLGLRASKVSGTMSAMPVVPVVHP